MEYLSDGERDLSDCSVAVLCGGVGAARFLSGLLQIVPAENVTAIVNVGDDIILHGLHISPDIDTIIYTLADAVSTSRGWGLDGETWQAMEMLSRYGGPDWFSLGDSDLGTHLYRTGRLADGAPLSEVTAEIASAWGLGLSILPVTNDRLETRVTTVDDGEIGFQEYFVGRQHDVPVTAVRFVGAQDASPATGVEQALTDADVVVIAPSNPVVSIDPVLAVPGVRSALERRFESVVAVSPIIGGRALKGPADRMLRELGFDSSVLGVATWYAGLAGCLIVDETDRDLVDRVSAPGLSAVVTKTIMSEPGVAARLAYTALTFGDA